MDLSGENIDVDASLIKIYCSGYRCFIWNSKDAREVREEHRIVGKLSGCLPRAPRQNSHLGLPLQLMPEEVTLLLEKGVAVVVENVYGEPTDRDKADQSEARNQSYQEQVELFKQERREDMKRNLPKIIEGKKAMRRRLVQEEMGQGEGPKLSGEELERKKAKRQRLLVQEAGQGAELSEEKLEVQVRLEVDTMHIPDIKEDHALVQLPMEALPREGSTCHAVDWSYPETPTQQLRYQVFRDFWERGHYLTSGSKFGGDFLVYPGDPARYHSFFIAMCKDHDDEMSGLDIITMGRLASNVKKTSVLCSRDDDGNICHTSLQWTGIS